MELENSQNNALAKLPMLKTREYGDVGDKDQASTFRFQDYALLGGHKRINTGFVKKNDVKARSHQLTFDQYVDAQSMFAAIKARFGGNEATKKTQKALLKQQYENFNASSSESLDSIFNRLKRLFVSNWQFWLSLLLQYLNITFLRTLPSETGITHVVVCMNKPDFDTMGLDDLYNNFKIVEQKVKRSAGANNDDKNLAFLTTSGASSTNNINTVNPEVSTGTTKVNTASTEIVLMRARKFLSENWKEIIIDGSSTESGYDKSKLIKGVKDEDASEKAHDWKHSPSFQISNTLMEEHMVRQNSTGNRSDNGTEFKNKVMDDFCREKGIKREYSVARTPQQNGVAERKNRTLIEAARTMLADSKLPTTLAEAVSTASMYRIVSNSPKPHNKTLMNSYRYSLKNKPMIEGNGPKWLFDLDSLTQSMNYVPVVAGKSSNDFAGIQGVSESSTSSQQDQDWIIKMSYMMKDDATKESHDGTYLKANGIANQQVNTARPDINTGSREVSTALPEVNTATPEDLVGPSPASEDSHVEDQEIELGNIPQSYEVPTTPHTRIHKDHPIEHVIEPKRVSQALRDPAWVEAMQEELLQFKLQKVWILVDLPKGHRAIGTKWVYRNKKDERGIVIRNKARLVAQGHTQEEGIDYDEVFGSSPRAWYDTLAIISEHGFERGKIDQTLFIKRHKGHILLVQIYVDDIIFGSTKKELCDEFEKLMKDKFQMSSMGELHLLFGITDVKSASTPTDLEKPLFKMEKLYDVDEHLYEIYDSFPLDVPYSIQDSPLELIAYTDSDYDGATQDRKSTTGGYQFLGNRLISWQCKKQTVVVTSITEAEYVAAASCCGQVLWIQNQLLDYGYNFMDTVIYIDNTSTICIIENPVQHSKTKHIEIRHHFIRDCNAKKLIQMAKIDTQHNVADLLTKGFDAGRFQYLVSSIGMLNP
ncbi:putative ribonuclease H-like domain-containing protein [Tanacetum coccineum]